MDTPSQRPRIAVLGSTYPRFHNDPQVPWLREITNRIAARGDEVTVIASAYQGLSRNEIDGIEVLRFRYAPARWENLTHDDGAPNKVRSFVHKLLAVSYIVAGTVQTTWWALRRRFDVIHVHWPFPHGIMAILAARLSGASVVATCHGAELALGRRSKLIRRVLAWCLLKADVLSCNSSHTKAEILKVCGRDAEIIPYGATVSDPPVTASSLALGTERIPTLLFCGRLIQRKGIHYLIRALPKVLARRKVRLLITGDGNCRAGWESLAIENGVGDAVQFLGFVSNERLGQLYREADIYVHPAIHDDNGDTEGLGVVLLEALQNERPVIASEVGGIVDVIEHEETGLLVPEKNEDALAEAILRLLEDPVLAAKLGRNGRKFAMEHFDWERITLQTENLYRRAMLVRSAAAPEPIPEEAPAR